MNMRASLNLKLSQQLALTPQLQQSIKLLQLSTVELNQELEKFLLENPLLERDEADAEESPSEAAAVAADALSPRSSADDATSDEPRAHPDTSAEDAPGDAAYDAEAANFFADEDRPGASLSSPRTGDGDRDGQDEFGSAGAIESLQGFLLQQLGLTALSARDKRIAEFVIAYLDDDGYLSMPLEDLVTLLLGSELAPDDGGDATATEAAASELRTALHHVQHLGPTGVGAQSLAECLDLQLAAMPASTTGLDVARRLVRTHLELLGQRDFAKLKRLLQVDDDELRTAQALITSLDPRPGACFAASDTRYIVPDVVVRKLRGRWRVSLNQAAVPRLRVNQYYADLVHKSRDADGRNLSGQLQEARWLIRNIQQRFDTILRVSEAIVENQRHFFDHGEVAMRPLVLREIADQVGLHESTVSRVTSQKYMLTPRGIFELKYFFGSSVATEAGGACSATAIRAMIKQLVEAEDQRKPLSDNKIADLLADQGILVARRTVAKYRESMQIQPANMRKSL
jgi:RNA polymerase sigma-54 factor